MNLLNHRNNIQLNESMKLRQQIILAEWAHKFNTITTPTVGHFVKDLNGTIRRICVSFGNNEFQLTNSEDSGSFNIDGGSCDYSGTCGPLFKPDDLKFYHEYKLGNVWFFKDKFREAHNGIDAEIPIKVWMYNGVFE